MTAHCFFVLVNGNEYVDIVALLYPINAPAAVPLMTNANPSMDDELSLKSKMDRAAAPLKKSPPDTLVQLRSYPHLSINRGKFITVFYCAPCI